MPSPEPSLVGPDPSIHGAMTSPSAAESHKPGADDNPPGASPQGPGPAEGEPGETPGETRSMAPDREPEAGTLEWPDLAAAKELAPTPVTATVATSADPAQKAPLPPQAPLPPPRQLSLPARLEAILYLKGKPLTLGDLAEVAAVPRQEAELALITLMADYAHRDTALEIRQEGQRYGLQLRDSLGDLVQSLLPVDLSTAALRTLATIALKKRILQSDLVELRGSGAYDHIKELLAQNFIERKRQSEGRSFWLSLSEKFHRTFAVTTVAGPARPPTPRGPKGKPQGASAINGASGPGAPGAGVAGALESGSAAAGSPESAPIPPNP